MLNRWIGLVCVSAMLTANTALVIRDVLPVWFATEPPASRALQLAPGQAYRGQVGIFNERGERVGTSWTDARTLGADNLAKVHSKTLLNNLRLPTGGVPSGILIRTTLSYSRGGQLDELDVKVHGLGVPIELHGMNFPGGDFGCEWKVGPEAGRFILPSRATRALSDAIRPFDTLPDLYVGRAWRVEVFNLLSHFALSQADDFGTESIYVRVVAQERILHRGGQTETFRVEAPGVRAWASPDGRVLRQEVDVPLLGKLVLLEEPFDEDSWQRQDSSGPPSGARP